MVSASVTTSSGALAVHTQVLFAHVRPLVSYGVTCSETLPLRKLPTGEPYARKPHLRFAGRGGESLPDPYPASIRPHQRGYCPSAPHPLLATLLAGEGTARSRRLLEITDRIAYVLVLFQSGTRTTRWVCRHAGR